MALDALMDLRNRLMSDVPLEAFFIAHYGKPARHLVGYRRTPNANDYPFLAYVPVKTRNKDQSGAELVSVIIGVIENEVVDNIMLGHVRVAEAVDLLEPMINEGVIAPGTIIMNDYEVTPDFGERHPIYETEVTLRLMRRKK